MAGRGMRALKNRLQERVQEAIACHAVDEDKSDRSFVINNANWSDYSSSPVWYRTNSRRLAEDFSMCSVTESRLGVFGHQGAWFPASWLNDADWSEWPDFVERADGFLDAVIGLVDYPLYDESDTWEDEEAVLREDWDGYAERDFRSELETVREKACRACQAWEADPVGGPVPQCATDHGQYDPIRAFAAFCRVAEGEDIYASGADVRDHVGRTLALYLGTICDFGQEEDK